MNTREKKLEAFGRLLDVLDELREKCPWDHKQTNESLRPNTIEEVYELCDALLSVMTARKSVRNWAMFFCTFVFMQNRAGKRTFRHC